MNNAHIPGYWMHETSGRLRPVVEAYLHGDPLFPAEVAILRVYLRQWIADDRWKGPMLDVLRTSVNEISTREDVETWLDRAGDMGIDPL